MNILNIKRTQNGVGLIEILIVLVVLVIAWAAIAALQGKLISGTSVGKARNEALQLAREKTEELRTTIERGQFDTDLPSTGAMSATESIVGVNATFNRSWLLDDVTDGTGTGYLKKLVMQVTWKSNEYDATKDNLEKVVLYSMVSFTDASKMATFSNGGTGKVGEAAPFPLSATEGPTNVAIVSSSLDEEGDSDGKPGTNDDTYTGVDENGNLVVFQGGIAAGNVELTVYGGKILKFSGLIYYASTANPKPLSPPYVRATSPSFCTTFVQSKTECGVNGSNDIDCARYVCYAGGDCSNGGDGCPADVSKLPTDLNGGWYGKIGDFFPDLGNAQTFPAVCMGDSVDVAARLYVTKRVNSDPLSTGFSREGINTSFECYDTLISTESPTGCSQLITDLEGYGIAIDPNKSPNEIADYQIIRPLLETGDPNTVLAATNDGFDNGVFPNFCSVGSSLGDTAGTYECSCSYSAKPTPIINSVTGVNLDDGTTTLGCCSITGCEDAGFPSSPPNNVIYTYTCPYTPPP